MILSEAKIVLRRKLEYKRNGHEICNGPAVFTCGDSYCVMFETQNTGTGYVRYSYDGREHTVYDSRSGLIRSDETVHCVKVPKRHFDSCGEYVAGSQAVFFKSAYSAEKGSTAETLPIRFSAPKKGDLRLLVLADVHGHHELVRRAVSGLEVRPNALLLLGDVSSNGVFRTILTDDILRCASMVTGGEMPVVYARGNHETRGDFAGRLVSYFKTDTDEFYYRLNLGGYDFIVLDTGEDKPDSNKEYSGLVDFNSYIPTQLNWLDGLSEESDITVVAAHIPKIDCHIGRDWTKSYERLGVKLQLSGHEHILELDDEAEGGPVRFVAGGIDADRRGGYVASMVEFSGNRVTLTASNDRREILLNKSLEL